MDITVVLEQLADIRRRIAAKPDLVYGTVTQVSPLRVRLDGDSIALTYTPACTFAGAVAMDDRVALMRKGSRYVVLGVVGTAPDTGVITTGITAAADWTLSGYWYRRVGNQVTLYSRLTYTGGGLSVSATGGTEDVLVATMPSGFEGFRDYQVLNTGSKGRLVTYYINTSGQIYLNSVAPGANIATSEVLSIFGTYLVD